MIKSITSNPRRISIIYLLLLIVAFFAIYSTIFDEKVSLVGDNASYYILGNSIANGDGYTNIQHSEKEAHYHYPPGYPVLIASVSKIFSNDIITIKKLNGAFLLGAILLLFFIIKCLTQNNHIAFAVGFITLLNYHILGYATIMMSEIPFLFFSLLCVLLILKIDFSKPVLKNGLFFLLLICLSFSFYIRSVALALFVSMVCFLMFKKKRRYVITLIGGFIALYLPWMLRNNAAKGNTYISQLVLKNPYQPEQGSIDFSAIIERISINLERYITKEIPSGILSAKENVYTDASAPITAWLLGFILIIGIGLGIYKLPKFRTFICLYVLGFFALLMIWPYVWYGTRFLVPLIPLLIFLFIFGMISLLKWLQGKIIPKQLKHFTAITTVVILSFWAIMYGSNSVSIFKARADGEYTNNYKNYFLLADWVQQNTPENSVTAVRKEGLFYLFSKKHVTNYQKTPDREAQIEYLKSKNVDYVVVEQLGFSSTSKYLIPAIDQYPSKFKIIKELKNPDTYLLQFLPELGYSGAWENDKRNGYGTYVWEDGQKYIGYWKNDVRDGKGTVFFKNGERLEGIWTDGKLNGEVIKKTKNNVIIERSIYKDNVKIEVINEAN